MKLAWRAAVSSVVLGFVVVGCGGDKQGTGNTNAGGGELVATVEGRPITSSYFEERLEKMDRAFLPDTLDLAGRQKFLEFIVNKEIMAIKAEEMGLGDEEQLVSNLTLIENSLLHRVAIEKLVEGKTEASEEEVLEFFAKQKDQRNVRHILLKTHELADGVHASLLAGADFDSMVEVHSATPRFDDFGVVLPTVQRSDFGWVDYGRLQPRIEEAIWGLEKGGFTVPVQSPYGWHVFKLVDQRTNRSGVLADQRGLIEQQIGLRKRRVITEVYYKRILADHKFKIHEKVVEFVYDNIPVDVGPSEAPDSRTEIKPVIPFSIDDRDQVLFELDGKDYTVGDYSDRYDDTHFFERPKRNLGSIAIYYWIRDGWLKELQLQQARDDGFAQDPAVADEIKFRREQMMVSSLHANLIANQIPDPSEEELKSFFEEHADTYVDPEKRICNLIFHPKERVVRRAYEQIQGGADFVETAIRFNSDAVEAKDVQTMAFTRDDKDHAPIADVTWALEKFEYSEPFKAVNGWVIVQLAFVVQEKPLHFADIEQFVARDIGNKWSEDRLNELLKEWKNDIEIKVFDKALLSAEVRRDDVFVPGVSSKSDSEDSE